MINLQRAHIQKSIIHVLESNPVEDKAALEAELRMRQEEEEKLKAQEKAYQVNLIQAYQVNLILMSHLSNSIELLCDLCGILCDINLQIANL